MHEVCGGAASRGRRREADARELRVARRRRSPGARASACQSARLPRSSRLARAAHQPLLALPARPSATPPALPSAAKLARKRRRSSASTVMSSCRRMNAPNSSAASGSEPHRPDAIRISRRGAFGAGSGDRRRRSPRRPAGPHLRLSDAVGGARLVRRRAMHPASRRRPPPTARSSWAARALARPLARRVVRQRVRRPPSCSAAPTPRAVRELAARRPRRRPWPSVDHATRSARRERGEQRRLEGFGGGIFASATARARYRE